MSESEDNVVSPIFFEQVLIKFLFSDVEIREKVLPYLTPKIFDDKNNMTIVQKILDFDSEYSKFPTYQEMRLYLKTEESFERLKEILKIDLEDYTDEFILDRIEGWFRGKLIWNINAEIVEHLGEDDLSKIQDSVDTLREACAFSFNVNVGIDVFESEDEIYEALHNKDVVVSSGIKALDVCIDGGFAEKTLSLFMAECIDENTEVRIRIKSLSFRGEWIEKEVSIKEVKSLLCDYDVEVYSPDGWVPVKTFVDKGYKQAWQLNINGKKLLSSAKHLYETQMGWIFAENLDSDIHKILCDDGEYNSFDIRQLQDLIKVVDIEVDHMNHRYYTNGVCSHNTNLGKSLIMGSMAVGNALDNKNVLYVTCEMSKQKIIERVLANTFDVEIGDLKKIPKNKFKDHFTNIRKTLKSKLVVEEYATRTINANHIRNLVKELRVKKKLIPDIIYIDYVEIMCPIHRNKGDNSYAEVKRISEELRGVAVELGIPIVSAVQTNRDGFGSGELDLTNISQSIGTAATADIIIGVTQTAEMRGRGMFYWQLLKNRSGINKKGFFVMVDYYKMRISDSDFNPEQATVNGNPKNAAEKKTEQTNKINTAIGGIDNMINNKNSFKDIE